MQMHNQPDRVKSNSPIDVHQTWKNSDEHCDILNKETVNIRKFQIEVKELKNTITEMKNILVGFNITEWSRRLDHWAGKQKQEDSPRGKKEELKNEDK